MLSIWQKLILNIFNYLSLNLKNIQKIVMGSAQFGLEYGVNNAGRPKESEVFSILNYLYANGIKTIDTANAYGTAIDILSRYHNTSPNRFDIINKFSLQKNQHVLEVKGELKRLKVDFFETYLFHSFQEYESCPISIFDQLIQLKEEGSIKKIGVSIYTNNQFQKIAVDKRIDVIQFPFNLLDNINQRGALMTLAKQNQKKLYARSIFLQGLFFKDISAFPISLAPLKKYVTEINDIADKVKLNCTQLALGYVFAQSEIDYVIIGIDNQGQLENNLSCASVKLPPEVISLIDAIHVNEVDLLYPYNWK